MNLNFISFLLVFSLLGSFITVGAQDWDSKLGFEVASFPEENGNISEGVLSWRFSNILSSSLKARFVNSADTSEIPIAGLVSSLNLVRENSSEVFLLPAIFNLKLAMLEASCGIGAYGSFQNTTEVGYFDGGVSLGINTYNVNTSGQYYGPVLTGGLDGAMSFFDYSCSVVIVPVFFYNSSQTAAISPYVEGAPGNFTGTGSGFPYLSAAFRIGFFSLCNVEGLYEFQSVTCDSLSPQALDLNLNGYLDGWESIRTDLATHTLTIRLNLRIPIRNLGFAELGYGKKFNWLITSSSPVAYSDKDTFKLSFNVER